MQGVLPVTEFTDGAVWDIAAISSSKTEGCSFAVAGSCPNCSAVVFSYSSSLDMFVADHASTAWSEEINKIRNAGGGLIALSSFYLSSRTVVGVSAEFPFGKARLGWNWTFPATAALGVTNALLLYEFAYSNGTFNIAVLDSAVGAGFLLGPTQGTSGRASYAVVGGCAVSTLVVPAGGSSIVYNIIPND